MSFTPGARRVINRSAIGVSLLLAVSGFAAPSLASAPARSAGTASASAPVVACTAGAAQSTAQAALFAGSGRRSGNTRPDDGMSVSRSVAASVQRQMADKVSQRAAQALPNNSVAIPVVAHIILGKKKRAGHMTRAGINDQLALLNQAYSGGEAAGATDTPFRFFLKKVTKTRNQKWYRINKPESRAAVAMKKRLHRGNRHTLNLYFVKFSAGLLGYSTFPWNAHGKKNLKRDGVVIDYRTRPGGELTYFNQGDTGTHEIGHWLGLLHTFEGGCGTTDPTMSGDFVADTPPEATPTSGCPIDGTKNTCLDPTVPDQPDPIHNFMDYAIDPCMTTFTPGQADRMAQAWLMFRA
ncbi:MAG: metalloprotease [Nocardioidaceae bacterium]|nr:metalloprotease [Nocardioidaceae bacterium]